MGVIISVVGAFVAGAVLRKRRWGIVASIFVGALFVPFVVAFISFVYPAEPETKMWAMIAIPFSYLWGLVASGFGTGLVALSQRGERDA